MLPNPTDSLGEGERTEMRVRTASTKLTEDDDELIQFGEFSAQQIADFLNENLLLFAITSFGDGQDTDRGMRLSERNRGIVHERFSLVLAGLKEALALGSIGSALEAIKAVESVALNVIEGSAIEVSCALGRGPGQCSLFPEYLDFP